jgi:hypothetical protein
MLPQFRFLAKLLLSSVQVVLAEKCHPLKDLPANPNNPKGLAILSDAFWDGCAFSASTGTIPPASFQPCKGGDMACIRGP